MPLIDHIDGPNRDIYLHEDTLSMDTIHPIDIYKEMRTLRKNDEELRKYDVFLSAFGNIPKGPIKATERYVMCNSGARIIPCGVVSHALTIIGTIITDDGQEGVACFDRSTLPGSIEVDINYTPKQVEVITVEVSTGVSTADRILLEQAASEGSKGRKMQTNKAIISGDEQSVSIYDDDGNTLLHQFSVSVDKKTRTPV